MDEISWNSLEGSFKGIILTVHENIFFLPATIAKKKKPKKTNPYD